MTGCLPQKFIGELFDPLTEADVFLGIRDYEKIFEALEKSYERNERENYVGKGSDGFRFGRVLTTEPHYAYLKIADGCYNHCTYCLIPKIRGRYVSYPMEDLLKEAEELGDVSELIVVAQDTTRYGEDLYGENRFVNLLSELSKLDNIRKIRLLYCYPDVIGEELIAEIRDNDKILKYIDIPLQHSENRILKLMNRKGGRESYLALLKKLREEIPQIAVRSTFISGFPGETEEDFEGMKAFLKEAKFANCGFLPIPANRIPLQPECADRFILPRSAAACGNYMRCKGKFRKIFSPLLWESPSKCSATESITIKIVLSAARISALPK